GVVRGVASAAWVGRGGVVAVVAVGVGAYGSVVGVGEGALAVKGAVSGTALVPFTVVVEGIRLVVLDGQVQGGFRSCAMGGVEGRSGGWAAATGDAGATAGVAGGWHGDPG
ncbi:hypothetical protein B1218_34340, partial [Pseudomonas ogarae]